MSAKGYPHKQPFNVKAKPNKRTRAWYKVGTSNNIKRGASRAE